MFLVSGTLFLCESFLSKEKVLYNNKPVAGKQVKMKVISIRKNPQWAEKAKAYCKEKWSDVYGPFEAALNQCLQKENGLPETWLMLGGMQQDEIKGVYQLCDTEHVETVVLLSHKKPDSHINIKVEFGEGEGKVPLDNIAKRAEAYKPKERVTYKK